MQTLLLGRLQYQILKAFFQEDPDQSYQGWFQCQL